MSDFLRKCGFPTNIIEISPKNLENPYVAVSKFHSFFKRNKSNKSLIVFFLESFRVLVLFSIKLSSPFCKVPFVCLFLKSSLHFQGLDDPSLDGFVEVSVDILQRIVDDVEVGQRAGRKKISKNFSSRQNNEEKRLKRPFNLPKKHSTRTRLARSCGLSRRHTTRLWTFLSPPT